jgi:hypothetical protein
MDLIALESRVALQNPTSGPGAEKIYDTGKKINIAHVESFLDKEKIRNWFFGADKV